MIDLYYWTTPNAHKLTIFLEESELDYRLCPVHIGRGEQFTSEFLAIAPNNRIPAIIDHAPTDGGAPLSLFESGAVLLYLAEKTGKFLPSETRAHHNVVQWLMWQMAGFGPMLGQNHHFRRYAPETIPYAVQRYEQEAKRLYAVLNRRLENLAFICDAYSIADMAVYPWTVPHELQGIDLAKYPHVHRWIDSIASRPAVQRAYAKAETINTGATVNDEAKKVLFGQTDTAAPTS